MPAEDYNATVDGALARTPIELADVSDDSHVTVGMIENWLDEGAHDADAYVANILGKTASSVTSKTRSQLRRYVEHCAAIEILARFSMRGTAEYTDLVAERDKLELKMQNNPAHLNDAPAESVISTSTTRADRTIPAINDFTGDDLQW